MQLKTTEILSQDHLLEYSNEYIQSNATIIYQEQEGPLRTVDGLSASPNLTVRIHVRDRNGGMEAVLEAVAVGPTA